MGGFRSHGHRERDLFAGRAGRTRSGRRRAYLRHLFRRLALEALSRGHVAELHALRDPHHRRPGPARTPGRGARAPALFSYRTGARWRGINGRRSPGATARRPRTWAISLTRGLPPNTCSPIRSLFAYELEADRALVLAAGLAPAWIEGDGVRSDRCPRSTVRSATRCGGSTHARSKFDLGPGVDCRLILKPPLATPLSEVRINGVPARVDGDSVSLQSVPAEVLCTAL